MGAVALTMGKSAPGRGAGQCRGSVAGEAGAEGAGQEEGLRSEKTWRWSEGRTGCLLLCGKGSQAVTLSEF